MGINESKEWEQGRIGEILQFYTYLGFGVEMDDLADRTHKRAPLLRGREATIVAPDTNAIRTGRFFIEFKTKSHHLRWRGGSSRDKKKYCARNEEGIDEISWREYLEAERKWRQPVVLSILSVKEGEMIAATLRQLSEPRFSPHEAFPLVNWGVSQFTRIASFDSARLDRLFHSERAEFKAGRQRWLERMPDQIEVDRVLRWLAVRQRKFDTVKQFIFDQIEPKWVAA